MAWKYVANAARLSEPDAISGTVTHLEDLWTSSGTGTASLDPQGVAGLWATTTSTLYVEDGDGDWVFVFHNNYHGLGTSLKQEPQPGGGHQSRHAVAADVETSWSSVLTASGPAGDLASTGASVTRYLQFQKADYLKFQDGLDPLSTDLESGLGLYEGMSISPFAATSIPYQTDVNIPWSFQYIQKYRARLVGPPPFHGGSPTVSFVTVLSTVSVPFYLAFRDPTVIEVPLPVKGGYQWLMIAKRVRVVGGSGTDGHTAVSADQAFSMLGANQCLSDIVVFKSNNPSFQNDDLTNLVKGPYLLVDSLASVEEDQNFRTSNRVPSAVFDRSTVGDRLFWPIVVGDLDGDGLDELAIPMWSDAEPYTFVFYGDSLDFDDPTSVLDADITFETPDEVSWGEYGIAYFRPTPLSDVDGDGVADVLWGSGYVEVDEREDVGIAWLWSGARLASPMVGDVGDADVTFTADLPYSYVGDSAADAGDVDGDSISDLLIHASGYDDDDAINLQPCAHLVLAAELIGGGTYNLDHAGIGFVPQDNGYRNAGPGAGEYAGGQDLDGDGVGDLLIGNGDWHGLDLGRIWMIPGGTLPL